MTKGALFLETSIQIARRFHHPKERTRIEANFKDSPVLLTSSYVKMEYLRRVIGDLIYLYQVATRVGNFGEILWCIQKLDLYQRRKLQTNLQGIGTFFYSSLGNDTSEVLEKLKIWLKQTIDDSQDMFDELVDSISDETCCEKARNFPQKNGETYSGFGRCKGQQKQCKIDEFFSANLSAFKEIVDALKALPPEEKDEELNKMEEILEKALQHPKNMLDYKNCWKCGDAIISVECPAKALLLTLNVKHYKVLMPAIEKKILLMQDASEIKEEAKIEKS
ncbi:MAG: hypothetical protein WC530_00360 [Candidatus Omnitrophota bacterium]|jgi:hypothetical protein